MVATIAEVKNANPVGTPEGELTDDELRALVPQASQMVDTPPLMLAQIPDIADDEFLRMALDPQDNTELLALRQGIKDTYGEADAARFDAMVVGALRTAAVEWNRDALPGLLAEADGVDVRALSMNSTWAVYRANNAGGTAVEKLSAALAEATAPGFDGDTQAIQNAFTVVMKAGMYGQPPEVVEQVAQKVLNKLLQQGPAAIENGLVGKIMSNDLSGIPEGDRKNVADLLQAASNRKISPTDTMALLLGSIKDLDQLNWDDSGIGNLNWLISAGEQSGLAPEALDRVAQAAIDKLKSSGLLPEPDMYAGLAAVDKWDRQDSEQGMERPKTFIGMLAWVLGHICQDRQDDVEENLQYLTSTDLRPEIDEKTGIDTTGNRDRTQVALSVTNASVQEYTMMCGLAKSIIDGMGQGMNKIAG